MALARKKRYTPEEYLEMDERSEIRHEFVNGEIYDMAGASLNHNQLTLNLALALRSALAKKPCRVFATDLRLRIKMANAYAYPDVMIICGKVEFDARRDDIVTNPTVIFEVLSDSTGTYDHNRKFALYRKIPCLQEYVLVDQHRAFVEQYHRLESGIWVYDGYEKIEDVLKLQSVELEIPLEETYESVSLEVEKE
jgi:Uma2 family endonuclease